MGAMTFALHNATGSIYRVFIMLGQTFVDCSGKIHVTNEYTII